MNSLSLLRRRTAPLAAAALLALALALAAAGGAAAAEENVIEFPLNQAIPGSQKLREVSQTSQSRNDLSKPSSPGRDPSTGLPNDVPADVAGSAVAADDTANASAPAPAAEGGKQKKKERIIGEARRSSWAERSGPWQPPPACRCGRRLRVAPRPACRGQAPRLAGSAGQRPRGRPVQSVRARACPAPQAR